MKRLLKILSGLVLAGVLVVVAAFVRYDLVAFQPHVPEIQSILDSADPEDRNLPATVREFILLQEGKVLSSFVARQLHWQLVSERNLSRARESHIRSFFWDQLLSLHFFQNEILSLYAIMAGNGAGTGLNNLASRRYGKKLSELSRAEAAAVVVFLRSPLRYQDDPEGLREHSEKLLARAPDA